MKNELLCNACAEKVGEEEIKKEEIEVFRELNKILKNQKSLKEVEIKRAIGNNTLIILTRDEDVSRLIGKEGSIVKKLAREFNKPIRVVGEPSDIDTLVNDVLFSVPIMGINIVYKLEGKTFVVRVPKKYRTRLPVSSGILANISKKLLDKNVDVIFE
jgi:transcription antitermination factor NusA-like protein